MAKFGTLGAKSYWGIEAVDREGNIIWTESNVPNVMTDEALNYWLNLMFNAGTQISAWYIIPFSSNYSPLSSNTYAVPGFTEYVSYGETNRQAFTSSTSTSKTLSNSASPAAFSITESVTVYGAALVGGGTAASTKGDVGGGGKLLSSAKFATSQILTSGITLRITATVTATDA